MRKENSERDDLFHLTALLLMIASFHSPLPEGGSWRDINQCGQQNRAEKQAYRHSFLLCMVYYRQSWERYLAKNCADKPTLPITRSRYVE